MKTIKGSTNPKAEEKTFYELSDFIYHFENPLFGKKENEKHIWTLYKQVNNNWKQVSGNIKYGEKVPYTFGEKAVGISFKIEVHTESKNILNKIEKKLTASLVVVPRTKHEPVIGRVILLNRDNADVNKATFNESLSAEARTSNLVGKEITFYLWEEGATEEKKYQKPKTAKVDIYGIAKIKFSLSEYATPQTWMSFFSGNHNTTKKFFVSASYLSKETTNKTPVSVTESQQQQPQQQTEKKEESTGFIEKATNIIAEGIGKIGDYVEEKTRTATSVGSGDVQKKGGEKICECEAKVRAFMRMLRVKEGSVGEEGYTRLFSKKDFTKSPYNKDMSTHPNIVITASGYSSSASGAYQIMQNTYKGFQGYYQDENKHWHYSEKLNYIKKYNISSFNQESQDKLCLVIFKHNYVEKRPHSFFYRKDGSLRPNRSKFNDAYGDIIKMIIENNFDKAILTSSLCWASLPDSPYGQPTGTKAECKANYEKFLKEELAGKTDLYLKKGFLKDFDYQCCTNSIIIESPNVNDNKKWHDPLDNPICTIFTQSQTNGIINYAGKHWGLFGTNARNGTRPHKGLDLFAIPGTSVYSCVRAEVTSVVDPASAGYGISITLKVLDKETFLAHKLNYQLKYPDKEDKKDSGFNENGDLFLFYGHLRKALVKIGDVIDDISQPIALSGVSGVQSGGTCAPHVHFEIRDSQKRRCNPGFYVKYKSYDDQNQTEINLQIQTAKKGKINEFNGKK